MGRDRRIGQAHQPTVRARALARLGSAAGRAGRSLADMVDRGQLGPADEGDRRDRPVRWMP
jgi:hypothetical protein